MAHGLNTTNGKVSMFYYGEKPWHELGQEATEPVRTWEEMCELAGIGYDVGLVPNWIHVGGEYREAGSCSTIRTDTGEILGNKLGPNYQPIQNVEAFNFLNNVAAEHGIEFHTAGALGAGERIWLMARIPGNMKLGKGKGAKDEVEKNLLLYNRHDGFKAMTAFWTPVRVVCANTVRAALQGRNGEGIVIRHSGEIERKIQQAQRLLGLGVRYYDVIEPLLQTFASTKLNASQAKAYFASLYPDPEGEDSDKPSRKGQTQQAARELLESLFDGKGIGLDMPSVKHTAWAAYNAVTEYTDHYTSVYSAKEAKAPLRSDKGAAAKLERMWFGDLCSQKQAAFEKACELCEVEIPKAALLYAGSAN